MIYYSRISAENKALSAANGELKLKTQIFNNIVLIKKPLLCIIHKHRLKKRVYVPLAQQDRATAF